MRDAMIYGDLSSDRAGEQYPTVPLCEDCIKAEQAKKENSQIVVLIGDSDHNEGPCEWCGAEDED